MSAIATAFGTAGGIALVAVLVGVLIWRLRHGDQLQVRLDAANIKINGLVDANASYARGVAKRDAAIDSLQSDLDASRRAIKVVEAQRDDLLQAVASNNPGGVAAGIRSDMERVRRALEASGGTGEASKSGHGVSPLHAAISGVIDSAHDAGPKPGWVDDPNQKAGS